MIPDEHLESPEGNDSPKKRTWILWVIVACIIVIGLVIFFFTRGDSGSEDNTNAALPDVLSVPDGQGLKLTFSNPAILDSGQYGAWIVLNGSPVSVGTFTIDVAGRLIDGYGDPIQFNELDAGQDITSATEVFITIEETGQTSGAPSTVRYLEGTVDTNGTAKLAIAAAEFDAVSGRYILSTPTDGVNTNETSGLWFLTAAAAAGSPETLGLTLPTLASGWVYEGWVTIGGVELSTGRFSSMTEADSSNSYSGSVAAPAFPGEDFLTNAPIDSSLTFPADLVDGSSSVRITIEPDIDSVDPTGDDAFDTTVLYGFIPNNATTGINYDLTDGTEDLTSATALLN